MLKAVVYDVNCTFETYEVSFNVILNFIEYIALYSSFNTAKVNAAIVRTKSNQLSISFVWSRTESKYLLNISAVSPGTNLRNPCGPINFIKFC